MMMIMMIKKHAHTATEKEREMLNEEKKLNGTNITEKKRDPTNK